MDARLIVLAVDYLLLSYCSSFCAFGIRRWFFLFVQICNVLGFLLCIFDNLIAFGKVMEYIEIMIAVQFLLLLLFAAGYQLWNAIIKNKMPINEILGLTIIIIIFFDIAGGVNYFLYKFQKVYEENLVYENMVFHDTQRHSTKDIYIEILGNDSNKYRIIYDNIKYFDENLFRDCVSENDNLDIEYVVNGDYYSIIGLKKDNVNFFEKSAQEIRFESVSVWFRWYTISGFVLILAVFGMIVLKIKQNKCLVGRKRKYLKIVFVLLMIIVLVAIAYLNYGVNGVLLNYENIGFGLARDNEIIDYNAFMSMTNRSFFPKEIMIKGSVESDVVLGFAASPDIEFADVLFGEEIVGEKAQNATQLEENRITIKPFQKLFLSVHFTGKYGGDGIAIMVRHGPDKVWIEACN